MTRKFIPALLGFLLVVTATQAVTLWRVRSLESDFAAHLERHLEADVGQFRHDVASLTAELEATASRLESRLAASPQMSQAALFGLLRSEVH
ncbi:MAG TPA: hypothetical protein VM779_12620, partial [Thermoanaerobaculia bacterium]|nr:hypothetical protein [Thermoanaerobaculia bacterium]